MASLTAFIVLGSCLSPMAALVAVYAIAVLAIQSDCAGHSTLFSKLGFDRWSSLTYSCYMLHIPVATVVLTFGARLLSRHSSDAKLMLLPVAIAVLAVGQRPFLASFRNAAATLSDRRLRPPLRASVSPCPRFVRQETAR